MEDILSKYLTLPEMLRDREETATYACDHCNSGERKHFCIECAEEDYILSEQRYMSYT